MKAILTRLAWLVVYAVVFIGLGLMLGIELAQGGRLP